MCVKVLSLTYLIMYADRPRLTSGPESNFCEVCNNLGCPARLSTWSCNGTSKQNTTHDVQVRQIQASQGVRQGCAIAPVLWLIYSHLISTELAGLSGHEAACKLLSIFAGDYHCSTLFNSLHQLESKLSHIGALFRVRVLGS